MAELTVQFSLLHRLRWLTAVFCVLAGAAHAQTLYWDTNGATTGAGGTSPSGPWASSGGSGNRRWTTSIDGTASTALWTAGRDAVFSAGTDATGSYTVTVSGTQDVSSILVQDGTPIFTGGTINFSDGSPDLTINSGRELQWGNTGLTSTSSTLNIGGGGVLNFTSNRSFAGTVNISGGTLRLTDANVSFGTLNITGNTIIDFAGSSSTLSLTTLSISADVVVTVNNWQNAVDFFYAANWTGATYNETGSAPMNQVFINGASLPTGWDSFDNQIRPIPEPSTYGALFLAALAGWFGWRRYRGKR